MLIGLGLFYLYTRSLTHTHKQPSYIWGSRAKTRGVAFMAKEQAEGRAGGWVAAAEEEEEEEMEEVVVEEEEMIPAARMQWSGGGSMQWSGGGSMQQVLKSATWQLYSKYPSFSDFPEFFSGTDDARSGCGGGEAGGR
jgi:hypothetical protein